MQPRKFSNTPRSLLAFFSLCIALIAKGSIAEATTVIIVNTTADDFTINGNCTLREAVSAANTKSAIDNCPAGNGADLIMLPSGVYSLTLGGLNIFTNLTISGAGSNNTIIDGNNLYQILSNSSSLTATVSGLTIRHGRMNSSGGGGIWNTGKLQLVNTNVYSNTAGYGGGIHNQGGVLTLINSTVSANLGGNPSNFAGDAGGIENNYSGQVTLINSAIISNVSGYNGGDYQ